MPEKNDLDVIAKIISNYGNGRITVYEALQEMTECAHKMARDLKFHETPKALKP